MEDTVRELLNLVEMPRHTRKQTQRVHQLWNTLREYGYTNQEITDLCRGKWSVNTIKRATRGTPVKDTVTKNNYMEAIAEMVKHDIHTNDIQEYKAAKSKIGDNSFKNLAALSAEIQRCGLSQHTAVDGLAALRMSNHTMQEVLTYHNNMLYMKQQGLGIEALQGLCNLSKQYGGVKPVLDSYYMSLQLIDQAQLIQTETFKLQQTQARKKALDEEWRGKQQVIGVLTMLILYGYNDETIDQIYKTAETYGGPDQVLEALNEFGNITELRCKTKQLTDLMDEICVDINRHLNTGQEEINSLEQKKYMLNLELCEIYDQLFSCNEKTKSINRVTPDSTCEEPAPESKQPEAITK